MASRIFPLKINSNQFRFVRKVFVIIFISLWADLAILEHFVPEFGNEFGEKIIMVGIWVFIGISALVIILNNYMMHKYMRVQREVTVQSLHFTMPKHRFSIKDVTISFDDIRSLTRLTNEFHQTLKIAHSSGHAVILNTDLIDENSFKQLTELLVAATGIKLK